MNTSRNLIDKHDKRSKNEKDIYNLDPVEEQTYSQQVLSMDLKIKSVTIVAAEKDDKQLVYLQKKEEFWKKVKSIEKSTKDGTPGEDSEEYDDESYGKVSDGELETKGYNDNPNNNKFHEDGHFHVPRYSNTTLDENNYRYGKDYQILRWPEAKRNKAAKKLWKKAFNKLSGVVMFINKTV